MNIDDTFSVKGEVRAYVFNGDLPTMTPAEMSRFVDTRARAECVSYYENHNLVTLIGLRQMTRLIVAETTVGYGYIGLTTSLTTPTSALTALTNEIKRNLVTVKESISTYSQRYIAYFTSADFASTGIAGAGGFDTASTGGNMYTVAAISLSKSASQGAVVEWRVTVST